MSLLKSSFVVSLWSLASRALGFARDIVIANKLGAGIASDAFFIALLAPNLLRRIFAEGAFNVAFVPLLTGEHSAAPARAEKFSGAALGSLLVITLAIVALAEIFMPAVVTLIAPGFAENAEKFERTVFLARITFPYLTLMTIASLAGAVCNMLGRFAIYAAVPALLNISLLVCLFAMPPFGVAPEVAAAIAIPIGGVAQMVTMLWALKRLGFKLSFRFAPREPLMKKLLRNIGPAAVGVGVLQISFIIDNVLASYLAGPAVTYLNQANRFYQLPLALIGITMATVLLPHFSRALRSKKTAEVAATFAQSMLGGITLAVASMVGLLMLAEEMLATLLQHGAFSARDAQLTAWAMMAYSVGLPGYITTKITSTIFYAGGDTRTPVKAAMMALAVNVVASIVLMQFYGHVGIALATAISGYTNAAVQLWWLHKSGFKLWLSFSGAMLTTAKITLLGGFMAALLYGYKLNFSYPQTITPQLLWLVSGMALGGVMFALASHYLKLFNLKQILAQVTKKT